MRPPSQIIALGQGEPNRFEGEIPDRVLDVVGRAELHVHLTPAPRARVLVCPGGGYVRLMYDREGADVAAWLNGLGYDAYVLVYRFPGAPTADGGVHPKTISLDDGLAGLAQVPRDLPVFVAGLSSGGHLAGVIASQPGADVAGLMIAYAPINANHAGYKAPADKPDYPPLEKQAFYNDWPIGMAAEPHGVPACPAFLACALHDAPVPIEHALNYIRTARDLGRDLDAHIFGAAPHGFALRERDGTHAAWPDLARDWLADKLKAPRPAAATPD
jgi:acetyl esterase/lipase